MPRRALVYLDLAEVEDGIMRCFDMYKRNRDLFHMCVANTLEAYIQKRLIDPAWIDPEAVSRAMRMKINAGEVVLRGKG